MNKGLFNSQSKKRKNMIISYSSQEKEIITSQIIRYTSVMEETQIELCYWDTALQLKATSTNICGLALMSGTLYHISLIPFKCCKKNTFH